MRAFVFSAVLTLLAGDALAVTSSRSVPSSFGGNGHNISFDGRLFLVRDSTGWRAQLLRPEATTYLSDGLPDATGPMLSPRVHVLGDPNGIENALAICEADGARAPYGCDAAGAPGGPYDCYDLTILYSDALTPPEQGGFVMLRRPLTVWVSNPKTADAQIHDFAWGAAEALSPTLLGIEPTVTRDGKLLVYQGHPDNDGKIDILMYTTAAVACAGSGWSAPQSISHMHADPAIAGVYALGERKLRAADGTPFEAGDLFHGAYPWLMGEGEAIVFTGANMPCQAQDVPPGCGPRRNALSVIGYPTNWGIAHIDGGVNPSTDDTVRLFFSSPGPATFSSLPTTEGIDVWPFFGSNTSNYVELIFDDGLDGYYAGFWHLNESITHAGTLDEDKSPDVSGYFNTAELHGGLTFAKANDGVVGKSLMFDGVDDRLEVAHAASLSPVNGITIDLWVQASNPDCDGNNNYRYLLGKGSITEGSYSMVLEESLALQARVNVDGQMVSVWSPPLASDTWTHVTFEYDGPSGAAGFWFDDAEVASETTTAGTITATNDPLRIGGPGARDACPDGDGAFAGRLDEVAISRYARRLGEPPAPEPGTGGGGGMGNAVGGSDGAGAKAGTGSSAGGGSAADANGEGEGGCACRAGEPGTAPPAWLWAAGIGLGLWRRRRR